MSSTVEEMRKKRKWKRKKRIIAAYAARMAAMIMCTVVLILMICGTIYLFEHLFQRNKVYGENIQETSDVVDETNDAAEPPEGDDKIENADGLQYVVVIDAGHGGKDEGTSYDMIKEKDIVLAIAGMTADELSQRGIHVIMTRKDDTYLGLDERTTIANDENADLFVSIHVDWLEDDTSVSGLTCHYMEESDSGAFFADVLSQSMEDAGEISVRRTMASDFYVLRNTIMPAVLVETGFLSNEQDRNLLTDEAYQQKLAIALADGITVMLQEIDLDK